MKPSARAKSFVFALGIAACAFLYLQMTPFTEKKKSHYHQLRGGTIDSLYQGSNSMFSSAGNCDHCHGKDAAGIASVDAMGNDINVVDDWRTSMMANSAKDPYWRAKVSHEISINPAHQQEIESLCTKCHAPMGRFAAQAAGQDHYSIAEMLEDSTALDGVSCLACHKQSPQPEVALHTGQLTFSPNLIAYGPYIDALITPMALSSGYTPEHGAHINDSKLCAACHSLVTQTVDLTGQPTGSEFVEQATWHEWLNSDYAVENTTCQSCHIPRLPKTNVVIAAGYDTPPRFPFGQHELVGGNALMLRLMKENKDQLGIVADDLAYDETISKTIDQLQNHSVTVLVNNEGRDADSLYFNVFMTNLTGHKLPSGYPARRMSLFVTVRDENNNVIFQSGGFNADQTVIGEDASFEPHYTHIREENQVQIYEMVMGDINGNRTTILERGAMHLKDNRLVPRGFSTEHPVYDTTEVVLNVVDENFNNDPNSGSGTDRTYYRIPTNGYDGPVTVTAQVYFQSVPPNWTTELFEVDTEPINTFEEMFANADKSPVLMKTAQISYGEFVGINEAANSLTKAWYKDNTNEIVISAMNSGNASLYTIGGQLITKWNYTKGTSSKAIELATGTYIIVLKGNNGKTLTLKILI